MKKYILAIIPVMMLLIPWTASAQSAVVSGVISDRLGPLPGATVYLQNKDERIITGVVSGLQGEYLLNVPRDARDLTLVIAFVGYTTVKVPYTGQERYDVRLNEDAKDIGDVIISATPIDRNVMGVRKEDSGSATQKIDVTEFEDMAATSIEDVLQGRMANLDIVSGGDPGSAGSIRIRGTASLSASNEPLIVIDGIPQDTDIDDDFDFGDADVDDFGALVNISPTDIESIEILKDASATALWGPRAANGVIIITTKQGGRHKPSFKFSQKFNFSFEPKATPMLNGPEYVTLMQDALWNWIRNGGYAANRINTLNGFRDILYDQSYEYFNEFNQNTDWFDLITRNGLVSTSNFSMDGGGEKANYFFSVGYENQTGTTRGTDLSKINSRLNVNYNFSRKFRVSSRFAYMESTQNQPIQDDGLGAIRGVSLRKMPNMSPYILDEDGNPTDEYFTQPSSSIQGDMPHPLAWALESMDRTLKRKVEASFVGRYVVIPGLIVEGTFGLDLSIDRNNKFLPASMLDEDVKWSDNRYNRGREYRRNQVHTYAKIHIQYNKTFANKHRMLFSFTDEIEASNNSAYAIVTSGNGGVGVSLPSAGGKITNMNSEWNKKRTVGLVGSVNYNYKELYSLVFAARMNANSNSGGISTWRNPVPSISGVWKIHNEKFMKPYSKNIDELRLRLS